MPRFQVIQGPDKGSVFEFSQDVSIGRARSNSFPIPTKQISRDHAVVCREQGAWVIYDKNSRNGVFINGDRVSRHVLADGDEVSLGNIRLLYNAPFEIRFRKPSTRNFEWVEETSEEAGIGTITIPTQDLPTIDQPGAVVRDLELTNERLTALYDLSTLIAESLAEENFSDAVLDHILDMFGAERGAIFQIDSEGALYEACVVSVKPGQKTAVSQTLLGSVLQHQRAVHSADVQNDERFLSETISLTGSQSMMAAPLIVGTDILGVLYVDTVERPCLYEDEDLALFETAARQIAVSLRQAKILKNTREENRVLQTRLKSVFPIVGQSDPIRRVIELISKVALTDVTVFITGETGTGKELAARSVHLGSDRRGGPFVPLDCSAVPESLLESELFGHEKGSFTGADRKRIGVFEQASGGTIFLDELGNMDLKTQVKLLRVLESRTFMRVGGTESIQVDCRVVAATNSNLEEQIRSGQFREDLYFRLNVFPIKLPPLRERPGDIPTLVDHFKRQFEERTGHETPAFSVGAINKLVAYEWPGNIRQLRNVVERALILGEGDEIGIQQVSMTGATSLQMAAAPVVMEPGLPEDLSLTEAIGGLEQRYIQEALDRSGGVKAEAARLLGITRPTLDKKIKDYDLKVVK